MLAGGAHKSATWPRSTTASAFDCFYVLPTTSLDQTGNTGLAVTTVETGVATAQAAPFSKVCAVWAPLYRAQTYPAVKKGLAGNATLMRSTFDVAYESLLSGWKSFLKHDDGRPIILIGDSQGSAILIHLISARIEHEPSILHRLVVAILVGGNLQVPDGKTVGSAFKSVPLCTSATQTGCAIAFSSYPSEPPADSVFGRPGQGTSLQSGQTAKAGQQVACVNPAALGGGTGTLLPYFLVADEPTLKPSSIPTPWVSFPDLYSARCEQRGGATWLDVTRLPGAKRPLPLMSLAILGPAWGYHGYEFGLALGNLVGDVAGEETAWEASH